MQEMAEIETETTVPARLSRKRIEL